ncbi:MAG: hypothetical protein LBT92_04450 [Rickettsiales bacterium]|nr:hypothetical protein [Rickettsiales bacterium]
MNPIETKILLSQGYAEEEFLRSFSAGALHHSLLITGGMGVGKATFAYRAARYVFAHNNPGAKAGFAPALDMGSLVPPEGDEEADYGDGAGVDEPGGVPETPAAEPDNGALALPPSHSVYDRMLSGALADFKIVERGYIGADRAKRRTEITVEQVRALNEFFSTTPAEGGYRVALIDSADEMNANAQNALLKLLEEPPATSIIMLVCHNPGRVLGTIRSRCRAIRLGRISDADMERLAGIHLPGLAGADRAEALRFARGSIGRAVRFCGFGGPDMARALASGDLRRLAALVSSDEHFEIFSDMLLSMLNGKIRAAPGEAAFRARDAVRRRISEARLNLDRAAVVISLMHMVEKC